MAFPTKAQFESAFTVVSGAAGDPSTIHVGNLYTALKAVVGNGYVRYPTYTTTERDALTGMAAGDFIYNSTTNKLNFYNGSAWAAVTSA